MGASGSVVGLVTHSNAETGYVILCLTEEAWVRLDNEWLPTRFPEYTRLRVSVESGVPQGGLVYRFSAPVFNARTATLHAGSCEEV